MSTAVVVAGAAFVAGFMWREVLIGAPSLRPRARMSASELSLVVGYYRRVCVTLGTITRGVLGAVILLMVVAMVAQLTSDKASSWAPATGIGLVAALVAASSSRTWPAARRLAADVDEPDAQARAARRLTQYQSVYVLMMIAVIAVDSTATDAPSATVIAVGGTGFLAATLWNEVLIDWSPARGRAESRERDRATLVGYYAVMTMTRVVANLAAVTLALGATLVGLVAALGGRDIASWGTVAALGIVVVFLALAGLRTWPAAKVLGAGTQAAEIQARSARALCRYHASFVLMLVAIIALQLAAIE